MPVLVIVTLLVLNLLNTIQSTIAELLSSSPRLQAFEIGGFRGVRSIRKNHIFNKHHYLYLNLEWIRST